MHFAWNLSKWYNHALAFGTPIHGKIGFVLKGFVDYVGPNQALGWVWDSAAPSRRLKVVALKDTKIVLAMVANLYRPDLRQAGIGDGHYAFDLRFPSDAGYEIAVQIQDGLYKIPLSTNALNVSQAQVEDIIDVGLSPRNFQSKRNILPRAIDIIRLDPNDNCNLRCVYCHNFRSEKLIDLSEFREFLNTEVDSVGTFQIGCGMEPTLDSRLCDFVEAIAESRARPSKDFILQTNGLLLHRHDYRRLAGAGINLVSISIDVAEPETQKALRGGMSLEKLLRNVKDFRAHCPGVSVEFIATVTTANVEKAESLVTLGLKYGISRFTFREVFYFPENPIVDHSRMPDLVLAAGQFEEMRMRILRQFGENGEFIFVDSNTADRSWRNMERVRSL
ncbi:MAG: radical SAM protein [Candidatus Acidiferrales bacterium]